MNQPYGYIYLIIDHLHNKVYVGQSHRLANKYLKNYYGSGIVIANIKRKRKHHLKKRILGYCNTPEELDEAEKICIEFYDAANPVYGYNIITERYNKDGYNCKLSTKEKISLANKGHKHSEETKQIIKEKRKQQTFTLETRNKMGQAHIGLKYKKHKLNHGNKGKKHSDATKKKYSLAKMGNTYRHDHCVKTKDMK